MQPNTVRVHISNPIASGRREGWWKRVTAVDPAGTNGYALEGDFLKEGYHDLPVGAVLVRQAPGGSVKNWTKDGRVYTVTAEGIEPYSGNEWSWTKQFVFLRDELLEALSLPRAVPCPPLDPLACELAHELDRIDAEMRALQADYERVLPELLAAGWDADARHCQGVLDRLPSLWQERRDAVTEREALRRKLAELTQ